MITDADINKMKRVFVTKEDLRKSMEQLVDLITVGFSRTDKALERLEEHDDILNNHEHRLNKIEDKIFL